MSARLALRGTHMSWYSRLDHIAQELMGAGYDKEELLSKWTHAREQSMSAPQAYQHLVALYLSFALGALKVMNEAESFSTDTQSEIQLRSRPEALDVRNRGTETSLANLKVLPRWCMLECDFHKKAVVGQNLLQEGENDEGVPVRLGRNSCCTKYYCGRRLGQDLIPGSDGQCGPSNGPQCISCQRFQALQCSIEGTESDKTQYASHASLSAHHRRALWFGDIPAAIATQKCVEEHIGRCKPRTMPPPFIAKVVRKSYRGPAAEVHHDIAIGDEQVIASTSVDSHPGSWFGFAIVVFRDEEEALEALHFFHGMQAGPGWTMNIKWADPCHQVGIKDGCRKGPRLASGRHPPLGEQLFPVSFEGIVLSEALGRHREYTGSPLKPHTEQWIVAEVVKAQYRQFPRREIRVAGQPIPTTLLSPLLEELRHTRWPAALHRFGMQSEQYLVLHRGKANEEYKVLRTLLEDLLAWTDPSFGCNRIAVTKDFQGSPHVDSSDVSPQYCCSLGDFDDGGQLCIEGVSPGEVYIVDTHDRMAKVDGRRVHWVSGHSGGVRFSIVFFATSPDSCKELTESFYDDFLPYGIR